jgi:hypothetical protein
MRTEVLTQIENQLTSLTKEERLWLLEWLAHQIRLDNSKVTANINADDEMARMANDPDIQRETREIMAEFSGTELDSLEKL